MAKGEKEDKQEANWSFTGDEAPSGANQQSAQPTKSVGSITWTASEYVAHDKSAGWYLRFAGASILIIGAIFLLTRDIFSLILLSILAVAFGVFAGRKPEVLNYELNDAGIKIGQKFYPMDMFRSFAVIDEGAFRSVTLLPMKRFMPAISLYFAPENEQEILEAFGGLLPQEVREQDPLDKFMHRIRF